MLKRVTQAIKGAALLEFVGAFGMALRYMAKPKATVIYPNERGPSVAAFPGRACPASLS